MTTFDVVVSAENNPYVEWQAMLFHHSCLRQLGRAPIVVVHGDGELLDGYRLIAAAGGRIQRAPSFRGDGGAYSPRNSAGTLACCETSAERVVLCDPDMIFLRDEAFDSQAEISVDRSTYLRVNPENREPLAVACGRAAVSIEILDAEPLDAGVPIVVSASVRKRLADEWLACIDLILDLPRTDRFVRSMWWLTSMWAFVFAVHRLGVRPATTALTIANERGARPPAADRCELPALLHYCYGDEAFDKRDFHGAFTRCADVWRLGPAVQPGLGARIRDEIVAARAFYRLDAAAQRTDEFSSAAPS